MALPQDAQPFARATVAAACAFAVWCMTAPAVAMPPVWPMGEQPVYAPFEPARLALLEPVLHAPWAGTEPAFVRWLTAAATVLGATAVAIFAGASTLATTLVVLALVLDASFAAALSGASGLVVAVGLVWLAYPAAFDRRQRLVRARPWFNPLAAMLLWSLAVWWHWIALVTWPLVLAALRRTPGRPARGWWTVASMAAGILAFVAHFVWMAALARGLSFAPGVTLNWQDALLVAFDSRAHQPFGSFVASGVTLRLASLGISLAAVGLIFGDLADWWRRSVLLSGSLLVAVAVVWPEWQAEASRFALWSSMPLAAVGLTWVSRQASRAALAPVITCLLGAVLLANTVVMGARPLAAEDTRGFRDALVAGLEQQLANQTGVIVAEDTRVDSALVAWASTRGGVMRVPQDVEAVAAAIGQGHRILAGPEARRHLELAGVLFAHAFSMTEPAPFVMSVATTLLRCVPLRTDRWSPLPGLDTGRLGLQIPPDPAGELLVIVGDSLPLRLAAEQADGTNITLRGEVLLTGSGSASPPADYWLDGGVPEGGPHEIRRLHLPAPAARSTLVSLRLGRRAPRVLVRLAGFADPVGGRACAAPLRRLPLFQGDQHQEVVRLRDEEVFGTGWYDIEGSGDSTFRWADGDAVALLPSAAREDVVVQMTAEAAVSSQARDGSEVTLRVNGTEVGTQPAQPGAFQYTWRVPAGTWVAGTNELWWHTSLAVRPADTGGTDTRTLALKVSDLTISRPAHVRESGAGN
jgi:hypothetical protein